jgi:hypothetical protein
MRRAVGGEKAADYHEDLLFLESNLSQMSMM